MTCITYLRVVNSPKLSHWLYAIQWISPHCLLLASHFRQWQVRRAPAGINSEVRLRNVLGRFYYSSSHLRPIMWRTPWAQARRDLLKGATYQCLKTRLFVSCWHTLCLFLLRLCNQTPECHPSFSETGMAHFVESLWDVGNGSFHIWANRWRKCWDQTKDLLWSVQQLWLCWLQ